MWKITLGYAICGPSAIQVLVVQATEGQQASRDFGWRCGPLLAILQFLKAHCMPNAVGKNMLYNLSWLFKFQFEGD